MNAGTGEELVRRVEAEWHKTAPGQQGASPLLLEAIPSKWGEEEDAQHTAARYVRGRLEREDKDRYAQGVTAAASTCV